MKKFHHSFSIPILTCVLLLDGCGSPSKENSESIKVNDMEIKDNEIVNEDGTQGFKGDIDNTNLQTLYEGLTFGKTQLVDGEDKRINGEEVPLNSKFSIVVDGIQGYTLANGKAFPKLSMMVTGDRGPVVKEENLLASYVDGLSPEDAAVLRGTVNIGAPMEVGKQYVCWIKISDKNNPGVYIETSWVFNVK